MQTAKKYRVLIACCIYLYELRIRANYEYDLVESRDSRACLQRLAPLGLRGGLVVSDFLLN